MPTSRPSIMKMEMFSTKWALTAWDVTNQVQELEHLNVVGFKALCVLGRTDRAVTTWLMPCSRSLEIVSIRRHQNGTSAPVSSYWMA